MIGDLALIASISLVSSPCHGLAPWCPKSREERWRGFVLLYPDSAFANEWPVPGAGGEAG
jgi:hypothetical protein